MELTRRSWMLMFSASMMMFSSIADGFCSQSGWQYYSDDSKVEDQGLCQALVTSRGYKCQEFQVVTKDGYILGLQRIPEGRSGDRLNGTRPPVLLQHGLTMDGSTWLINSPQQSLGFILADLGFDVWIANTRGTRSSNRHKNLNKCSNAYWDWSWNEILDYDFPAFLDFVYGQTGQKLHYVGHSLGTLVPMASFSQGKQVDKIRSAAFLTPIGYLNHMPNPILYLAAKTFLADVATWMGLAQFDLRDPAVTRFLEGFCHYPGISCYDLASAFTGANCCLNKSTTDLFLQHLPQPTSTRNVVHLAQNVRDGVVARYDYGNIIWNLMHYGSFKPPRYNLANIPRDVPLFLSYGGRDTLADTRDVTLLLGDLKKHDADKIMVQFVEDYAHLDFVTGVNAKEFVYDEMIAFLNEH